MRALPWWMFAWVLAASVVVMMFLGLRWAQLFGVAVLVGVSAVLTLRESRR